MVFALALMSCANNIDDVNALTKKVDTKKDIGKGLKIIYSDSSIIKVVVTAPTLLKSNDLNDPVETFPDGIHITFYDDNQQPSSWLKADHAIRNPKIASLVVKGNVSFENASKEKLQTSELTWYENDGN
jgi:hypothetical protein